MSPLIAVCYDNPLKAEEVGRRSFSVAQRRNLRHLANGAFSVSPPQEFS
jgi:hypothetical protein